ncbi:MAG: DEAD/DEAH box helicase [DPANN group archaeon]|nr:DEAD/DEAH box helicase [DPANN group archaeon]
MLVDFKPRLYQETIFSTAAKRNSLVVLPTGMGKTGIALMLAAHRLKQHPRSKVLILAPTKPLVEQLMNVMKDHLDMDLTRIVMFTGNTPPETRKLMWQDAQVIASTPQGLENDIISRRINLQDVSLLVLDEAHRAVGDYAYVWIAQQYQQTADFPLLLALTASPGSDKEKIQEIIDNLRVENIEIRSEDDPDIKPYIQDVEVRYISVDLPDDFKQARTSLNNCFLRKLKLVKEKGYLAKDPRSVSKKDILMMQGQLQGELAQGLKDFDAYRVISLLAEAMKVQHALELLETQGIASLHVYLQSLMGKARTTTTKAVKNLVMDPDFRDAFVRASSLMEKGAVHPKMTRLFELVKQEHRSPGKKVIIFNHYRDNAHRIVTQLNTFSGIQAELFVGQAKKNGTGITQKEQIAMLRRFREGEFNTIVMTAVGEEGLDIPQVDTVIFYEPIPSVIRHIQRRGRTGRLEKGKVIVLITKGTRDEAYRWSAHHKEKRMHSVLGKLKHDIGVFAGKKQPTLQKYVETGDVLVYADDREKGSNVIKELINLGVRIALKRLDAADYVLSSRVAVEFKTVQDFVDSLLDGRLLQQVKTLKQTYERPLVLVQGIEDIYSARNIHPNAIRGMIAAITVSFGVPILYTKTAKDTAAQLFIIASREQEQLSRNFEPHGSRKPLTEKEQLEYAVSSFPGISIQLAKALLEHFGSIKGLVNAGEDELKKVEKIGAKRAKELAELFRKDYAL